MNDDDREISANIRAEAARKGLNGRALARAVGMSPTTMGRRMRGEIPWTIRELRTISATLGVPLSVLLPGVPA